MEQSNPINQFNEMKYKRLLLCVLIDLIGFISYFIPAIGEISDAFWGPVSGIFLFFMFGGKTNLRAYLGGLGGIVEEVLPGTDFIPTASLLWAYTYIFNKEVTYNKFLEKNYKRYLLPKNK